MNEQIKQILLMQLQLLQEACEEDMFPPAAAELSKALAKAVDVAMVNRPLPTLKEPESVKHQKLEVKLDEEMLRQASRSAMCGNPRASGSSNADSGKTER